MSETYLTVQEAVKLTGYHPVYLRRLLRAKKIQADKKGNQWWIYESSLLDYMEKAKQVDDRRYGAKNISPPNQE